MSTESTELEYKGVSHGLGQRCACAATHLAPIMTQAALRTAHPQPMSRTSFSSISSKDVAAVKIILAAKWGEVTYCSNSRLETSENKTKRAVSYI